MTFNKRGGFTLMEVMVVVLIVSFLAAFASPSYQDYVVRSKITQAISGLSARQVRMEQCYQDNHTYAPTGGCSACGTVTEGDFTFSCSAPTATTFTLTATGLNAMNGFVYTVDQSNARQTTGVPSGWAKHDPNNCWITKKGAIC
jgi:type IV pilus assembly protein PilE